MQCACGQLRTWPSTHTCVCLICSHKNQRSELRCFGFSPSLLLSSHLLSHSRIPQTPPARWVASANAPSLAALSFSSSLPLGSKSDTYSTHLSIGNSKQLHLTAALVLRIQKRSFSKTSLRSPFPSLPPTVWWYRSSECPLSSVCGPRDGSSRSAELAGH